MKDLEKITAGDRIFAIVLRKSYSEPGASFFTPSEFSQQLGMLVHKKGKKVDRHKHKLLERKIFRTQEVLVLLEGKVKIDLFDDNADPVASVILQSGDAILLAQGGHSVEIVEDSKLIEVKQGPYSGLDEKEYF